MSTIEACNALLTEGQDLDTGEAATQVGELLRVAVLHLSCWGSPCKHTVYYGRPAVHSDESVKLVTTAAALLRE